MTPDPSVGTTPVRRALPADFVQGEILHQSERTLVQRMHLAAGPGSVICKEPTGPQSLKRLQDEEALLNRLRHIDGVVRLADVAHPAHQLVLEDDQGIALAQVLHGKALTLEELLRLMLQLALTVAAVHRAGVVHRDINPANILLCGVARSPKLIDFHLATTFSEVQPDFAHQRQIVGTLAYLAPEQSGRTGRSVDQRADLYALGASFYEMATGHPPFALGDALQMIHDHLVRAPAPPTTLNATLPLVLSDIILRLLEKEPERRYQSAEGLAHDVSVAAERLARNEHALFALGERDFPWRLTPPSRLVGRTNDVAALQSAFESSLHNPVRGVLLSGPPGVGKTALLNELRSLAATQHGWFVMGSSHPNPQGQGKSADATQQAMAALGRLLLAEPEDDLAPQRGRAQAALGPGAGLITAFLPEFEALLGPQAAAGAEDQRTAETQLAQACLALLRAIVSPRRPLIMVLDDLQWASASSLALMDTLLTDDKLRGLLIVGAFRSTEVDAAHALTGLQARWDRQGALSLHLPLENLSSSDLGVLLAGMLRLEPGPALQLAQAIHPNTLGNPFDTVELLNALRRDRALVIGDGGWQWDAGTVRRFVGHGSVIDLLAARIARLEPLSQDVLAILACLGGDTHMGVLQAASGLPAATLAKRLAPAIEDGLVLLDDGPQGSLRFRHDRVLQAVRSNLAPAQQQDLHLALGRHLAERPEFQAQAAQQYLPAAHAINAVAECRRVTSLFREAAMQTYLVNDTAAERFLAAALALMGKAGVATAEHADLVVSLRIQHHATLYHLGRLDEADQVYQAILGSGGNPLDLSEATRIQIGSLTNRRKPKEAVTLGLSQLQILGLNVPSRQDVDSEVALQLDTLFQWLGSLDVAKDQLRPVAQDPQMLAAARLINQMVPPAIFTDPGILAWLVLESRRLWVQHGPCAPLVAVLSRMTFVTITLRQDYRAAYDAVRHVLAVGEALGFEPETSQGQFIFAQLTGHWFEPLEDDISRAQHAREGLLRAGKLQAACFTYSPPIAALLDTAPNLEGAATEAEAALAFAKRTGNDQSSASFLVYRQLARSLRGDTEKPGCFTDATFDETAHLASLSENRQSAAIFHIHRALAAALLGDWPALHSQSAAAMPLLTYVRGFYPFALAHLMRALALAQQARTGAPAERPAHIAEFDLSRDWLALRAADAPGNFLHLQKLVDAERAWVLGDFQRAITAFDAALHLAAARQRPWHRALIAEHAALFHLEHGLEHHGRRLLADARDAYGAWGATAKVTQMEGLHPFLRSFHRGGGPGASRGSASMSSSLSMSGSLQSSMTTDNIDMLAILHTSQALSSETSLGRLQGRVVELLREMTGATQVQILLCGEDRAQWHLFVHANAQAEPIPVAEAGARGLLPLSAFRYAERTREPLLVEDATKDDRFARDPYVHRLERCSLLLVPIMSQGALRAMLLLENRISRGAFSVDRLDAVLLVAGQLAVSLENALLYASLERKVAQRTEALELANQQLALLSTTDPLTGLSNRRRFNDVLAAEWQRGLRSHGFLGAVMIDIDQFKLYNDHYGHQGGDDCLKLVANALARSLRQGVDLVARYGGEEFALILPTADLSAAARVAERVRAAVEKLQAPHAIATHGIVTISVGVAAWIPSPERSAEALFAAADAALYQAKQHGRNQVATQEGT